MTDHQMKISPALTLVGKYLLGSRAGMGIRATAALLFFALFFALFVAPGSARANAVVSATSPSATPGPELATSVDSTAGKTEASPLPARAFSPRNSLSAAQLKEVARLRSEFAQKLHSQSSVAGCHGSAYVPPGNRCEQMDRVLSLGKRLYLLSPGEYIEVTRHELDRIEDGGHYNYLAVLAAALSQDRRLVPALEKTARVEDAQQIKYKYATAAAARLRDGKCPEALARDASLLEICTFQDPDFNRLHHLAE